MVLSKEDIIKASRDPRFLAARWKQRVARSQEQLDKTLSGNASRSEKEQEIGMHRKRIEKMKQMQENLKNI